VRKHGPPPSPRHTAHFRCSGTPSWSSSTSPLPRVRPRFASVSLLIFRGACVLLLLLLLREGAFVSFLTLPKSAPWSHVTKQPSGITLRVPRRPLRQRDRWVPAPLTPRTRRRRRARREQFRNAIFLRFLKSSRPHTIVYPPRAQRFFPCGHTRPGTVGTSTLNQNH
jgi:hypothetical protein